MTSWLRIGVLALVASFSMSAPLSAQDDDPMAALQQNCTSGDMTACNALGGRLYNGNGVAADRARAIEYFSIGCDGDYRTSCRNLGILFATGTDADKDMARSAGYYAKACDLGEAYSCGRLGELYFDGEGVAQDRPHALQLHEKSCDGGSPIGCFQLGGMYYNGEGVPQDKARAVGYFTRACDAGDPVSCRNAGVFYGQGEGVEKNVPRAALYYGRACEGGDEQGCGVIDTLETSCVSSYTPLVTDGEFGPGTPKIVTFIALIGGDAAALFGQSYAGIAPSKAGVDQPLGDGSTDMAMNRLEPGEAQIVIWGDGASRYVHKTPELTDTAAALAQLEAVCGLMGKGIVVDSANSQIILASYTVPAD